MINTDVRFAVNMPNVELFSIHIPSMPNLTEMFMMYLWGVFTFSLANVVAGSVILWYMARYGLNMTKFACTLGFMAAFATLGAASVAMIHQLQ